MAINTTVSASAVADDSLTTVARVKSYAGETTTDNDAKWTNCLAAASRLVEAYCDRLFLSASRTEYYDGRGYSHLTLRAYPITVGPKIRYAVSAMDIAFADTTNYQAADITCDSAALVLTRTSSAGVATVSTLSFSGYATLTLLAAAVNAVANGWSASVTATYATYNPNLIRNTQGQRDAFNEGASLEVFAAGPGATRVNPDTGTVWLPAYHGFPWGNQNIKAIYTGGYTTMPDDLIQAVCAVTASLYRMGAKDQSVKSERIGDYSYTLADRSTASLPSISPDAALLLAPYKRPRLL